MKSHKLNHDISLPRGSCQATIDYVRPEKKREVRIEEGEYGNASIVAGPRNGMSKTEKNSRSQHGLIGINIVAFSLISDQKAIRGLAVP